MPELPEVETIRISLEKKILGLTIKNIQILNAKSFMGDPEQILDAKVVKVWRRAKVLGMDLQKGSRGDAEEGSTQPPAENNLSEDVRRDTSAAGPRQSLLFHLKMSGQVIFVQSDNSKVKSQKGSSEERFVGGHPTHDMLSEMPNKHTRLIFEFSDGSKLYFNDQRKFGWIRVIHNGQLKMENYGYKNEIGPEPLEKEFTWQVLKSNLLKHKKTSVKVAILDSTVVAGVGNIYACEACFLAKIHPKTKVSELNDMQIKNLHQGIVESLQAGIKYGGSTRTHFVDADGKKGLFLDYCYVYNRNNQSCKICGTKIEKIKLGGRGTFFCSHCQK